MTKYYGNQEFQGVRDPERTPDNLRQLAGLVYMTDPGGLSFEELHSDSRFSEVSIQTLRYWARSDAWRDKRAVFWKQIEAKARAQISTTIASAQVAALQQMMDVRNVILAHILGKQNDKGEWEIFPVPPKSLEGLTKALLDLQVKQFDIAAKLGGEMTTDIDARRDPLVPVSGMSVDAIQAEARRYTQRRREVRERGTPDAAPELPPPPAVDASTTEGPDRGRGHLLGKAAEEPSGRAEPEGD